MGHVARTKLKRTAQRRVVASPEARRPAGEASRIWKVNIKIYLKQDGKL